MPRSDGPSHLRPLSKRDSRTVHDPSSQSEYSLKYQMVIYIPLNIGLKNNTISRGRISATIYIGFCTEPAEVASKKKLPCGSFMKQRVHTAQLRGVCPYGAT